MALYAFDASEKAVVGVRQREWEAVGDSELAMVREMTMCLTLIREGKVPKGLAGRATAAR